MKSWCCLGVVLAAFFLVSSPAIGSTGQGYEPAAPLASSCVPGSPCEGADCIINATCSSTGECIGSHAPDGTFCATPPGGCTNAGTCLAGACACGTDPIALDLGTNMMKPKGGDSGCQMSGAAGPAGAGLLLLALFVGGIVFIRRRA